MKGSIRRRSKTSWELTIDMGRGPDGKRQRKFLSVQGKRADADRKLRELMAGLDKGIPVDTSNLTVGEYLAQWHAEYAVPHTRARTAERYLMDIRLNLTPRLGNIALVKVRATDVQTLVAELSEHLSPASVKHALHVLSSAYRSALQTGLVWHNPCAGVRAPRLVGTEIAIPPTEVVNHILTLSRATPHHAAFHFLAYTGCRRGEAAGLQWQDLDLDSGKAFIRRSAARVKGQGIIMQPPKTKRGERALSLDKTTVELLRTHQGDQLLAKAELGSLYSKSGFVFAGPFGDPLDPFRLTDTWRRLSLKAGAPGFRLHDLRHHHASMLLRANVHPKVVQERLGHSTIAVTLDIYSHSVPGLQAEAAETFSRLMESQT